VCADWRSCFVPDSKSKMVFLVLVVLALNVVYIQTLAGTLPERVATHFGFNGEPDGWMTRRGFVIFAIVFPIVISAIMVGIAFGIRNADPSTLKVANAEYWRRPEHFAEATSRIFDFLCIVACVVTMFFGGVWLVVAGAQSKDPPRLNKLALIAVVMPLVVFLALGVTWLNNSFKVLR